MATLDERELDIRIDALAAECAAEAVRQGCPCRELSTDEDAGSGDYEALSLLLGRDTTQEERTRFRAAYSVALGAD